MTVVNFRPGSLGIGGNGGEFHRDNDILTSDTNLEITTDWYPFRTEKLIWQASLGFIPHQAFQTSFFFVIGCEKNCKIDSTSPRASPAPAIIKGLTLMGLIDHNLGIASQAGNDAGKFQYGTLGFLYGIRSFEFAHLRLFVFLNYYPVYAHFGGKTKGKSNEGLTTLRYGIDYKF